MKKHTILWQLLTASMLACVSGVALAASPANQVTINETGGATDFGTDVNTSQNNGDTVLANINGVNHGYVVQNIASTSSTDVQQNGAGDSLFVTYGGGTSGSTGNIYQGNSATQAAINSQPVNVANGNDAYESIGGTAQTVTEVQKGDYNAAATTVEGNNVNIFTVQQMTSEANPTITDAHGNVYKGGNDSEVNVAGANLNVTVNQYQGNVSKVNGQGSNMTANIQQVNTDFDANRTYNNVSTLYQQGSAVTANVNQNGAGEGSNIYQVAVNSSVNVTQTNGGAQANIVQGGDTDAITISQAAPDNATVTQYGGHNTVKVTDTGITTLGSGNTVNLPQNGNGNTATITQTAAGSFAGGNVVNGTTSDNTLPASGVTNGITVNAVSPNNATWVGQKGDNNTLTVSQTGQHAVYYQQVGEGNGANITQTGDYSYARLDQIGEANTLTLSQSGTSGVANAPVNVVDLLQQGGNNSMQITQSQPVSGQGTSNAVAGLQIGNGDQAIISQTGANLASFQSIGDNNLLKLTQDNTSAGSTVATQNVALVTQSGEGDSATIGQSGASNFLNITQQGNGLGFSVTQTGHQTMSITQTHN